MKELSSYVFSSLREGDLAFHRGSGNALAPILLVAADETSLDCISGLNTSMKELPLAVFLDDLQWLDTATLDLLEHLVTHLEVRHLLLVRAFPDDEISPAVGEGKAPLLTARSTHHRPPLPIRS